MSEAEAIPAVLGIISSVIAIADGIKKVCDAAGDATGLPGEFREVARRLPIVQTILTSSQEHIKLGNLDQVSCQSMLPVVESCDNKAKKLKKLFDKVLPQADASRAERYLSAVKTLGKGGRVEILMKGILQNLQLLLINYGLRVATKTEQDIAEAIEEVSKVESSVPDSAFQETTFTNNNYGPGPMTNYNVKGDQFSQTNTGSGKQFQAATQVFHMENKDRNTQAFHASSQTFISNFAPKNANQDTACQLTILDQLAFPGMDERYYDISETHKETFQWIYERPDLRFVEWLRKGEGVYWITGKAGSGKSTLMKYLYTDPRTPGNLPTDCCNVLLAGFFFHDRGKNPYLKSQEGLFRAILHSILSEYRQLICIVLPRHWEKTKGRHAAKLSLVETGSFSLTELKLAFKELVAQKLLKLRLLLVIDGLDEFSGHHQDIIDTLSELLPNSEDSIVRVQLCLSSRPLVPFEDAYREKYVHLRVHDLTTDDIQRYVTDRMRERLFKSDPSVAEEITEEISRKSDGVFLWVTLVVRSLLDGLQNRDNIEILRRRLSALPAGLVPLYAHMLRTIDSVYRKETATLLSMVECAALPLSPLALFFADDDPEVALRGGKPVSESEIQEMLSVVETRLKARSAGLIEISGGSLDLVNPPSTNNLDDNSRARKVQYLHLTVKEFLLSAQGLKWAKAKQTALTYNPHLLIVACHLRQMRITGSLELYTYPNTTTKVKDSSVENFWIENRASGIIFLILFHAREAEVITQCSLLAYLTVLDETITATEPKSLYVGYDENGSEITEEHLFHWTLGPYRDWTEPRDWLSDFIAYLITIGMTRSVIDKFQQGYKPDSKEGRPLLLYASCQPAPDYAITDIERDTIDPELVEALLERGCQPNQPFDSSIAYYFPNKGTRTVWEFVLRHVEQRFCTSYYSTEEPINYEKKLESDDKGSKRLKVRWLKTLKLFLDYGADATAVVLIYGYTGHRRNRRRYIKEKISALRILNKVFAGIDDPLVDSVRQLLLSKGAADIEEILSPPGSPPLPPEAQLVVPDVETLTGSSVTRSRLKDKMHKLPILSSILAKRHLSRDEK